MNGIQITTAIDAIEESVRHTLARLMTNHPNRRARGGPSPSGLLLRELRERAGLTQAQAGALVRVSEIAWRSWENGARRMPAPAMELLCIVLAVGTVARGPYVPPGDWMLPWVRGELCLWFRRPVAPLRQPVPRLVPSAGNIRP